MRSYYDIIGRPKKTPFKERLSDGLITFLLCLWFIIAFGFAIHTTMKTGSFGNGVLAFVMLSLLGFVLYPVCAVAMADHFAIIVCIVYLFLIVVLICLKLSKRKLTKSEEIEELQLQILGKTFEEKYPRAAEIKKEYNDLWQSQNRARASVQSALKSTSAAKINEDFVNGRITLKQREKLLESYNICKERAKHEPFLEEVTKEIGDRLKRELVQYVEEFEAQLKNPPL